MPKMCALMRQSWYESATKNLSSVEQLAFFRACFDFEFYGKEPTAEDVPFSSVLLMFDMVKDSLEADKVKAEAIAMRNRRNGLAGGRPKKVTNTETQTEPRETQKTQMVYLDSPLHNNTQHNTTEIVPISLSPEQIEKEDKFFVCLYFFANGVLNPCNEVERFWGYYSARGWRLAKDVEVQDKRALCKTWKPENMDSELIPIRAKYVSLLQAIKATDMELIERFVAMLVDDEKQAVTLKFRGDDTYPNLLETKYLRSLCDWMPKKQSGEFYALNYYRAN